MSAPRWSRMALGLGLWGLVWALLAAPAAADVRLPHVIGSHMVLQREMEVPIWGWAEPGEQVTVEIAGATVKATADGKGDWMVRLPAMKAGGPHAMAVKGKNTIQLDDILVGEVWIGSGQSNMEWSVGGSDNAQEEIAAAKYPNIRLFHVPKVPAGTPQDDVNASWRPCDPGSIRGFSAVLYFFGRELHKELNIPVGLIATSWGGTRIEPWTPPEGFQAVPAVEGTLRHIEQANDNYRKQLGPALGQLEAWISQARKGIEAGKPVPSMPAVPQHPLANAGAPTGLYNGMVHPLVPFAVRGATWYQGESNNGEGMLYHERMKALIAGWRAVWKRDDLAFYYVQLAPFTYGGNPLALPGIWEAQAATLAVPHTGMAVITDIGNVRDIHPRNKQDVGKRLALWALAKDYGKEVVYSGPLYKAMKVEGNKIHISFDHVGGGLASRDGKPLSHFQIAGNDKTFVVADAEIDDDTVVVSSAAAPEPVAVRFGWHQTAEPNLMNKEGLPASPFRTDKW